MKPTLLASFIKLILLCRSVSAACRLLWLPQSGAHGTACYAWLTDYGFPVTLWQKTPETMAY